MPHSTSACHRLLSSILLPHTMESSRRQCTRCSIQAPIQLLCIAGTLIQRLALQTVGNAGGSHPQLEQQLAVLLRQVSRHRAQRRNQVSNAP